MATSTAYQNVHLENESKNLTSQTYNGDSGTSKSVGYCLAHFSLALTIYFPSQIPPFYPRLPVSFSQLPKPDFPTNTMYLFSLKNCTYYSLFVGN